MTLALTALIMTERFGTLVNSDEVLEQIKNTLASL
jgi:hypothetical protein